MLDSPEDLTNEEFIDFTELDAVFLDLDDTLVEYRNSCIEGLNRVGRNLPELSSADIEILEKDFREILRNNLPGLFDGKFTLDEERKLRLKTLLERHNISVGTELLERCDSDFQKGFWNSRNVIDGALNLLKFCRDHGIKVVVVTNGDTSMQKRTLELAALNQYVDHLLTPSSSSELKPSTAMFEKALSLTGAERNRTVMIGDTWHQDIQGAINSGIKPFWLNSRNKEMPEDPRVVVVKSLSEIVLTKNGDEKAVHQQ